MYGFVQKRFFVQKRPTHVEVMDGVAAAYASSEFVLHFLINLTNHPSVIF